jgi:hypothetical protein
MAENGKVYNLESFTDEERERVEALINHIEEEKKKKTQKWWIVPTISVLSVEYEKDNIKCFCVEEQKDSYSKDRPPVKSDFASKEEAEEWLNNYLEEEKDFKSARNDIDNVVLNLGHIVEKFRNHEYVTEADWRECFRLYNESKINGALYKVTKRNKKLNN